MIGVVLMFAIPFGAGFATRLMAGEGRQFRAYAIGLAIILLLAALLLAASSGFVGAPLLIFPVFAAMFIAGAGFAAEIKKLG
jgi:TRAP-type mannitol/chloroaromatic compound transport system permease large subunit